MFKCDTELSTTVFHFDFSILTRCVCVCIGLLLLLLLFRIAALQPIYTVCANENKSRSVIRCLVYFSNSVCLCVYIFISFCFSPLVLHFLLRARQRGSFSPYQLKKSTVFYQCKLIIELATTHITESLTFFFHIYKETIFTQRQLIILYSSNNIESVAELLWIKSFAKLKSIAEYKEKKRIFFAFVVLWYKHKKKKKKTKISPTDDNNHQMMVDIWTLLWLLVCLTILISILVSDFTWLRHILPRFCMQLIFFFSHSNYRNRYIAE